MAYYADSTPYNYHHHSKNEFNIGWLQKDNSFTKGEVSFLFIEILKKHNERPFTVHHTRGFHGCDFCEQEKMSGFHEIRVVGADGKVYACPELIIHYVESHQYLPPQEFIDAVIYGPLPGSEEYNNAIRTLPESWEQKKEDLNYENHEEKMKQIMVDGLTEEINNQILKDIMEKSPDFKKLLDGYKKVMPAVYNVNIRKKSKK